MWARMGYLRIKFKAVVFPKTRTSHTTCFSMFHMCVERILPGIAVRTLLDSKNDHVLSGKNVGAQPDKSIIVVRTFRQQE